MDISGLAVIVGLLKKVTDRDIQDTAEFIQRFKPDAGSLIIDDLLKITVAHHVHSFI